MTDLRRIFLIVVGFLGLAFLAYALFTGADVILKALAQPGTRLTIATALGAYVFAMLAFAVGWVVLLRAVSERMPTSLAVAIFLLGQIPKYVPGNVAYLLGRFVFSRRFGIGAPQVTITLAVEIFVCVAFGLLAVLYLVPQLLLNASSLRLIGIGVVTLLVVGLSACLALYTRAPRLTIFGRARAHFRHFLEAARKLGRQGNLALLLAYVVVAATAFVFLGLFLRATVEVLDPVAALKLGLIEATAGFAAAWVVGALTPGAPAGIGVREAALLVLLSPLVGHEVALAAAVLLRLLSVLGDAIIGLIGAGIYYFARPSGLTPTAHVRRRISVKDVDLGPDGL
jgi:uncharacterized membrane protein YbhN (UPF0104 family)